MPRRVKGPDGIERVFPSDATDEEISAALGATLGPASAPSSVATPQAAPSSQSDIGGPLMVGAAKSVPSAAGAAMEFATNPNVPKMAASVGRVIGGIAPAIAGGVEGGPVGALAGAAAASKGAWAGGKTGWFSGKLLQEMSAPVAKALTAIEPYLQTVSKLGGAQSALDVAQMAEPNRKDIGTLGVSMNAPRSQAEQDAHPALLNLLAMKASDAISELMKKGVSIGEATRAYWTLKSHLMNGGQQ